MPGKGRSRSLSRLSRNGQGHREARSKETQEQRLARLDSCRRRSYKSRLKQSADGTAERLANHRAEYRQKRNIEQHTLRESMLALCRNRYNNALDDGNHIQTQQQRELQQTIKTQKNLGSSKMWIPSRRKISQSTCAVINCLAYLMLTMCVHLATPVAGEKNDLASAVDKGKFTCNFCHHLQLKYNNYMMQLILISCKNWDPITMPLLWHPLYVMKKLYMDLVQNLKK